MGTPLADLISRQATYLLLGLEPIDWHGQSKQQVAAASAEGLAE